VLAVLPGSRAGEIARLGGIFVEAVARLRRERPALQVVSPMADPACREQFAALDATGSIRLVDGRAQDCMIAADAVLLASGTAALEAMLCKRPMVVAYRVAGLTHRIVTTFGLLQTRSVSLPNILAGEALVPELLQDDCNPAAIAAEVGRLLDDPDATSRVQPRFAELHAQLRGDASRSAAAAIIELIGGGDA
jgi:lipid-A-disaccharide synthase